MSLAFFMPSELIIKHFSMKIKRLQLNHTKKMRAFLEICPFSCSLILIFRGLAVFWSPISCFWSVCWDLTGFCSDHTGVQKSSVQTIYSISLQIPDSVCAQTTQTLDWALTRVRRLWIRGASRHSITLPCANHVGLGMGRMGRALQPR